MNHVRKIDNTQKWDTYKNHTQLSQQSDALEALRI